jgi:flagellar protein FlaG
MRITIVITTVEIVAPLSRNQLIKTTVAREVKQTVQPKETAQNNVNTPDASVSFSSEPAGAGAELNNEEVVTGKMKDAIDKVNSKIIPSRTRCEFSYHEETKRVSIKVIDQATEETIREIPAEETLDMLSRIWELAGLMVDEKR